MITPLKPSASHLCIAAMLTIYVTKAQAACSPNACEAPIDQLMPFADGHVRVWLDADMSPLDCTLTGDGATVITASDPGAENIYSFLLSASLANRNVFVRITNGSNPCSIGYVKFDD